MSGRLLYQMELLDIPGDGSLGAADSPLAQVFQELLLGLHIFFGDDVEDHSLTVILHPCSPPGSIFCANISQKLFSDRCTRLVT